MYVLWIQYVYAFLINRWLYMTSSNDYLCKSIEHITQRNAHVRETCIPIVHTVIST